MTDKPMSNLSRWLESSVTTIQRDARIAAFREAVEMVGEMEIGSTSFYAYCLLRARADELEKEEK